MLDGRIARMSRSRLLGLALYKLGTFLGGSAIYIPAKHLLASWGVPPAWTGVLAIVVCTLVIAGLWLRRPRWLMRKRAAADEATGAQRTSRDVETT